MCIICVQLEQEKMKALEAHRALSEYVYIAGDSDKAKEHKEELIQKINAKADKERKKELVEYFEKFIGDDFEFTD